MTIEKKTVDEIVRRILYVASPRKDHPLRIGRNGKDDPRQRYRFTGRCGRNKTVNSDFLRSVARLGSLNNGPALAQEFLANHGIYLVLVGHLKKIYLDGATMVLAPKSPVVGLTLRYDRIITRACLRNLLVRVR